MRGLTRSARGTDGPTQQNLCTHVCGYWIHASLSIICLFTCSSFNMGHRPFNLINARKPPATVTCSKPHRWATKYINTKEDAHAHVNRSAIRKWVYVACGELCSGAYGTNVECVTINMWTVKVGCATTGPLWSGVMKAGVNLQGCWDLRFGTYKFKNLHRQALHFKHLCWRCSLWSKFWVYFKKIKNK